MKRVSRSFSLSTIQEGISYSIVWTDVEGTTTTIPCYSNGVAKTVPSGYGSDPWLTAMLYKAEGSSAPTPCEANSIIMKSYDIDGNPITTHPTKGNSSFFAIEKYYHDHASEAKYEVEFLNANNETLAKSAICRTLDGTKGKDGVTAQRYNDEFFAWSNKPRVANVYEEPEPNTGWQQYIQPQGTYAYLWKKIVSHVLNQQTGTYSNETPQYFRMTGEQGTQVRTKGSVQGVVDSFSQLPASSDDGDKFIVQGETDFAVWSETMGEWGWDSASAVSGDAYTISKNCTYKGENVKGHLFQLNYENSHIWVDLGQFTGMDGVTYYTHVAWATGVYYDSLGEVTQVVGFTETKQADDTTHLWMGVLVDTNSGQDPDNAFLYTWSYIKGNKGDDGNRGHIGRFYYYGGVFDPNNSTKQFVVNDSQIPFFESHLTQKTYYVYNPSTNPANNEITMAQMWSNSSQSFNNAPWEAIFNDFKYLITEAIFSNYAKLGSFIINGDWMISQNGVNNKENPSNPAYLDFTPLNDGTFDQTKFVPNFAVNAKTGETFQKNAHVEGEVIATSGTFTGIIHANDGDFSGNLIVKSLYTTIVRLEGGTSLQPVQIPLTTNLAETYVLTGDDDDTNSYYAMPNPAQHLGLKVTLLFTNLSRVKFFATIGGSQSQCLTFAGYLNSDGSGLNMVTGWVRGSFGSSITLLATTVFSEHEYMAQWVIVSQRGIVYLQDPNYQDTYPKLWPDGRYEDDFRNNNAQN